MMIKACWCGGEMELSDWTLLGMGADGHITKEPESMVVCKRCGRWRSGPTREEAISVWGTFVEEYRRSIYSSPKELKGEWPLVDVEALTA